MKLLPALRCFRWLVLAAILAMGGASAADLAPADLRCDAAENPLGIDSTPPRLSWKLRSEQRGQRQTAWQVLVASSAEILARDQGDAWDSGVVKNDEQLGVSYGGRALHSTENLFWKVRVWDRDGKPSAWSVPATWTMGVLAERDWIARWITDPALLPWVREKIGYRSAETADEAEPKWVRVDLGQSRPITMVRLHAVRQVTEEGQGFPRRFKIEASDNPGFDHTTVIADFTARDFGYTTKRVPEFAVAGEAVAARYVRVVTNRLKRDDKICYFALSQFEVVSGGRNVAVGATVAAKDSEEGGRWSAASLTDGKDIPGANPRDNATLLVRREFTARPPLRRAVVQVSGLGHYELTLNGCRVGEDLFSPGWTTYEKTDLYDTYEVTHLIRAGGNALGLTLASGMYNVRPGRYVKFESLFRPLATLCQLRLEYTDGSVELIATDARWKVHPGPITFSNMYGGEDFDARLVPAGWDLPGFADASWTSAAVTNGPGGTLRGASHAAPPLRAHETLKPVAVKNLRPGVSVYDLGQNVSLLPRLRMHGPAGATVKIIPAELLQGDGSADRESVGGAASDAWWSYTLEGGEKSEAWFPKFFYHGCRYLQVELTAPDGQPLPVVDALEGIVVHTASLAVGEFACSDDLFNRIHLLVRWAQRSNLVSVLTDCPHRERLGWLEQYHLNGPALRYEFDLTRLYAKTFGDMADAQLANGLVPDIAPEYVIFSDGFRDSPEWGSAIILAAWQHYTWTGDDALLRQHFDAMQRYVGYLAGKSTAHIVSHGLGDWYDLGPGRPGKAQLTPIALTATAFYFEDVKTLAAIARVLGRGDDAARLDAQAAEIKAAFNREFFHADTGSYATGSQCANALPLVMELAEPAQRARVLDALVADVRRRGNAITAGDVGYRYLLRALADAGRSEVIFDLNHQSDIPGYGYQLAQGATSLTEAWNADRRSSQNHFMLGQINEWFYRDLAGLAPDPAAPGWKSAIVRPQPVGGLAWAHAAHASPRGKFASSWKRDAGRFTLEVEIPPGAMATVFVPASDPARVTEGGRPAEQSPGVRRLRAGESAVVYAVESGRYVFAAPSP